MRIDKLEKRCFISFITTHFYNFKNYYTSIIIWELEKFLKTLKTWKFEKFEKLEIIWKLENLKNLKNWKNWKIWIIWKIQKIRKIWKIWRIEKNFDNWKRWIIIFHSSQFITKINTVWTRLLFLSQSSVTMSLYNKRN